MVTSLTGYVIYRVMTKTLLNLVVMVDGFYTMLRSHKVENLLL